jgi:hypothetical protein
MEHPWIKEGMKSSISPLTSQTISNRCREENYDSVKLNAF